MKQLISEVTAGSQAQASGVDQIANAITQMQQLTQTTAATAEESASAAVQLTAQPEQLKGIVARLNAMVVSGKSERR